MFGKIEIPCTLLRALCARDIGNIGANMSARGIWITRLDPKIHSCRAAWQLFRGIGHSGRATARARIRNASKLQSVKCGAEGCRWPRSRTARRRPVPWRPWRHHREIAQRPDGFRYVGLTGSLAVLKERILCCFHVLVSDFRSFGQFGPWSVQRSCDMLTEAVAPGILHVCRNELYCRRNLGSQELCCTPTSLSRISSSRLER